MSCSHYLSNFPIPVVLGVLMERAESMVFWSPGRCYRRLPLDAEQVVLITCELAGDRTTTIANVSGETWIFDIGLMQAHLQTIATLTPTTTAAFIICTGRPPTGLQWEIPQAWWVHIGCRLVRLPEHDAVPLRVAMQQGFAWVRYWVHSLDGVGIVSLYDRRVYYKVSGNLQTGTLISI